MDSIVRKSEGSAMYFWLILIIYLGGGVDTKLDSWTCGIGILHNKSVVQVLYSLLTNTK